MIQQKTLLKVVDNSGAKKVRCIKVLGGFKRKTAKLGDIIVVSVQQLRAKNRQKSRILKGGVARALIVKTAKKIRKVDGSFLTMATNSVIMLNKQGNPLGTRILSSLPRVLKKKKYLKYLSICPGTF